MFTTGAVAFRFLTNIGYGSQFVVLVFLCLLASGCAKSETAMLEQRPVYQPSPTSSSLSQLPIPKLTAPKLAEVEDAVRRVFKDAAVIDRNSNPSFVVGDFNGDQSEDVAIVLKPVAGQLPAMNEEYPAWLLRDPFGDAASTAGRIRVEDTDTLLAIIHGYGANDWHDDQATQTFLLKNAVGSGLAAKSARDLLMDNSGRKLPRLHGDVISEMVHGEKGYLYFASATYSWYDPKTFKGESQPRAFHGMASRTTR